MTQFKKGDRVRCMKTTGEFYLGEVYLGDIETCRVFNPRGFWTGFTTEDFRDYFEKVQIVNRGWSATYKRYDGVEVNKDFVTVPVPGKGTYPLIITPQEARTLMNQLRVALNKFKQL